MSDEPSAASIPEDLTAKEPQWQKVLIFALLVIGLYICSSEVMRFREWHVRDDSRAMMEARAWQEGRLDLAPLGPNPEKGNQRPSDTAYFNNKIYHIYPPLYSAVCYVGMKLVKWQQGWQGLPDVETQALYPGWFLTLVVLPLPVVGFWAFRTIMKHSAWAAVLTAYWLLATPIFPVLATTGSGQVISVCHIWSNIALLLIAGDMLGKRRIWPSGLGLLLGAMSRQLTFLFVFGIIWIIWRESKRKVRDFAIIGVASTIAIGTLATMNYLKFGNPLDTGYMYIYEGRNDYYAQRAHMYDRLFDLRFLPENAFFMSLGLPEVREARGQILLNSDPRGTSLWLTSPLLLCVFLNAKHWWRDPRRRTLMLASFLVMVGFLSYHNTGSVQRGMFRFALDVIPIWLACIAPFVVSRRMQWFVLGCLAWGTLYNHLLCTCAYAPKILL